MYKRQASGISVYPNPSLSGTGLRLLVSNIAYSGKGRVEIRTAAGQNLYSQPVQLDAATKSMALSIGKLPAGLYIIGLKDHTGRDLAKAVSFIIQ